MAGVLEGFYGPPWTWDARREVMRRCAPGGLPYYLWAPKDDDLHRRRWRDPFPSEYLEGFASLLAVDDVRLGVAVAPGLEPNARDLEDDVRALVAKLAPVVDLGASLVMVAFDDIDERGADGRRHGELVSRTADALAGPLGPSGHIAVVPTHYATICSTPYLAALCETLPGDVLVAWTGPLVVNDTIDAADALAFADAVDGRPLLVWDNYPVNDALMADRAFLLPATGRDPTLSRFCHAYFANAGVQPWLSLPALLAAGKWAQTGRSEAVWEDLDDPVDTALLAQACDGRTLYRLAQAAVAGDDTDLWWWLERIEDLHVAGLLGREAAPWIEQARAEARLCLLALDLLEREPNDPGRAGLVVRIWRRWPRVRAASVSVFGPRFSLAPEIGVDRGGVWTLGRSGVTEGRNATDVLCRAALQRAVSPAR